MDRVTRLGPRPSSSTLKNMVGHTTKMVDEEEEDDDLEEEEEGEQNFVEKKVNLVGGSTRRGSGGGGSSAGGGGSGVAQPCCQVETCGANLTEAKLYHKRHKVCEVHAKAPVVMVAGLQQRFCQQCSRFHEVSEFDEAKRSCRRRLAGHNERRRKNSSDGHGESSSSRRGLGRKLKESHRRLVDERGRAQIALPGSFPNGNFHVH